MEEIFNKIIDIDKKAKDIVESEKNRKINIEEYIEKEFTAQKALLDAEFKNEIDQKKKMYDNNFEEVKQKINSNSQKEIEEIEKIYREQENDIIQNIINSIKKEED